MSFLLSCLFFTQANLSSLVCYSFEKKLADQATDTLQIVIDSSMAISAYENVYEDIFWVNRTPVKVVPPSRKKKWGQSIVITDIVYEAEGVFFLKCRYHMGSSYDQIDVYFDFEDKEMVFFRRNFNYSVDY